MYITPDESIEAINDIKEDSGETMKINKKLLKQTKLFEDVNDDIDDHDDLLSSYGY